MTSAETGKLLLLLEQFYPNAQVSETKRMAWELALEPYIYDDIRDAAIAYVRRGKFFPDLADLTADIPLPAEAAADQQVFPRGWMLRYIKPDYTPQPDTHYAAVHGCTVGEAGNRRAPERIGRLDG